MPLLAQEPSWNQAHRIGQIRRELAAHVHNPHYTVWAQRITPALSSSRLMSAWQCVSEAHRVLSSRFDLDGCRWLMPSSAPEELAACEVSAQDFATALTRSFQHATESVSRLVIARDADSLLVGIAADHMISDGWSLAQLSEDLIKAYHGQPLTAENRFAEYVRKQNEHLRTPGTMARADSIVEKLADIGGVLPPVHIGPSVEAVEDLSGLSARERGFTLGDSDWKAVQAAAPAFGISPSNLTLAALHLALARLSGSPYAGSTMTLANRHRSADQGAVGSYAAKMAVTVDTRLAGSDNRGYLEAWRSSLWSALDTSDIPWAYLLHRLHPEDFGNFTRRRYATFNFQPLLMNAQPQVSWGEEYQTEPVNVPTGRRDQALATFWMERPSQVSCLWEYRTDAFDDGTVTALWDSFTALLSELCTTAPPSQGATRPAGA